MNGLLMPMLINANGTSTNGATVKNGFNLISMEDTQFSLSEPAAEDVCTISNVVKKSYLEKKTLNWKPVSFELINNSKLLEQYNQIRNEFKENAKESSEYEEHYAFLIENDSKVDTISRVGYVCPDNSYNVLGNSKYGVYLCKHADVMLKYAEKKHSDETTDSMKMIVFKICLGKQTCAMVRTDVKLAPIMPTLNFDSHLSIILPKEKDDIEHQFDHSQIFLYETESNKMFSKRPRHCLPYAIINWQKCQEDVGWPFSFVPEETLIPEIIQTESDSGQNGLSDDKPIERSEKHIDNANQETTALVNGTDETSQSNNEDNIEKNESNENNPTEKNAIEEPALTTSVELENKQEIETKEQNIEAQDNMQPENASNEANQVEEVDALNKEREQTNETVKDEANPDQMAAISVQPVDNSSITAQSPSASQPATTPNANSASSTTPTATTPTTITTPNKTGYYKSTPTYRHNPTIISPYVYPSAVTNVQPYHPYGIRLPYHQAQQLQLRANSIQALQNAAALAASPFGTFATPGAPAAAAVQQPVFLCRTPNGLAYVTAQSPNVLGAQANVAAAHQLALAQAQAQAQVQAQVQAQALIQQQQQQQQQSIAFAAAAAAAHQQQQQQQQQLAASFQTSPSSSQVYQKYANPTISPNNAVQIQAHQMIYQAAAQPANSTATAQSQAKVNNNPTQQQTVTSQSPKPATTTPVSSVVASQTQSNAQVAAAQAAMYAQMGQMPVMSYSGNPSYYASYASMGSSANPTANQIPQQVDQSASTTSASNLILSQAAAAANAGAQSNAAAYLAAAQQNQLYAYAQQQQAQAQQHAQAQQNAQTVSAANLNGLFQAAQTNPAQAQLSTLATIQTPTGYQLVDYRQLQAAGLAPATAAAAGVYPGVANIQFDQLAGNALALARPRLFTNLRHHPYQR